MRNLFRINVSRKIFVWSLLCANQNLFEQMDFRVIVSHRTELKGFRSWRFRGSFRAKVEPCVRIDRLNMKTNVIQLHVIYVFFELWYIVERLLLWSLFFFFKLLRISIRFRFITFDLSIPIFITIQRLILRLNWGKKGMRFNNLN